MRPLLVVFAVVAAALNGCGGGGSSPSSAPLSTATATPTPASTTSLQSAYQNAQWQNGTTVSFSGSCSMTIKTTGVPAYYTNYYLVPAGSGQTVVAQTAVTKTNLALIAAPAGSSLETLDQTFNICPAKAATPTATSGGEIGIMLTGEVLFNPYEASQSTAALSDNASYTFSANGISQTAYFIDTCNSHSTMTQSGLVQWHFHGVPACLTNTVDGAAGPSHIIGIALDGYPIYGGRDINGNAISTSQLDACNGITSATPEFPNGIYHYVLPIGVTSAQSSLACYSGTVPQQLLAENATPYCGLNRLSARRRAEVLAEIRRTTAPLLRKQPARSS